MSIETQVIMKQSSTKYKLLTIKVIKKGNIPNFLQYSYYNIQFS